MHTQSHTVVVLYRKGDVMSYSLCKLKKAESALVVALFVFTKLFDIIIANNCVTSFYTVKK